MIGTVLLVFSMNELPLQVSQTKYQTLDECADFVELLAGMPVIDNNYSFKFESIEPTDGSIHTFAGQCVVDQPNIGKGSNND